MSNDIQERVQKQISWATVNSHHNGLIARASRSILSCTTMNSVMGVISRTLDELGLSGGGRLKIDEEILNFQFGGGLNMSHCTGLSCLIEPDEQIYSDQNALVFNEDNFLLIVTLQSSASPSKELLKENLAVFVDIVQGWLMRAQNMRQTELSQRNQRVDLAMKMTVMIDCLGKLSQHLVHSHYSVVEGLNSQLLTKFSTLALDPDQEDEVIDVVNDAMEKQKGLLTSQLNQNDDLKRIMKEAITALVSEENDSLLSKDEILSPQNF